MAIGERIKERREAMGMTQRELSDIMGYANHSTIARIESGKVDLPQSRIKQFAEVLKTTVAHLMEWDTADHADQTTIPNVVANPANLKLWSSEIGLANFTTDELHELINYAKYIISKR